MYTHIADIKSVSDFTKRWFSGESMRFFGTLVVGDGKLWFKAYNPERLFVTSDYAGFNTQERRYTIRRFNPDTLDIDTLGDFGQYASLSEAYRDLSEGGYQN